MFSLLSVCLSIHRGPNVIITLYALNLTEQTPSPKYQTWEPPLTPALPPLLTSDLAPPDLALVPC